MTDIANSQQITLSLGADGILAGFNGQDLDVSKDSTLQARVAKLFPQANVGSTIAFTKVGNKMTITLNGAIVPKLTLPQVSQALGPLAAQFNIAARPQARNLLFGNLNQGRTPACTAIASQFLQMHLRGQFEPSPEAIDDCITTGLGIYSEMSEPTEDVLQMRELFQKEIQALLAEKARLEALPKTSETTKQLAQVRTDLRTQEELLGQCKSTLLSFDQIPLEKYFSLLQKSATKQLNISPASFKRALQTLSPNTGAVLTCQGKTYAIGTSNNKIVVFNSHDDQDHVGKSAGYLASFRTVDEAAQFLSELCPYRRIALDDFKGVDSLSKTEIDFMQAEYDETHNVALFTPVKTIPLE